MDGIIQDIRHGVRAMRREAVTTAAAVLSLALGITATVTMFAVLDAYLLEPLPFAEPDGLVVLREGRVGEPMAVEPTVAVGNYEEYRTVEGLAESALYAVRPSSLTGLDRPERIQLVVATPSLFDVLGVPPAVGRGFRAGEGTEGRDRVVVLQHDYWMARFAGDPSVVGRTLEIDGEARAVVGVTAESFDMIPANVQAFVPSDFAGCERTTPIVVTSPSPASRPAREPRKSISASAKPSPVRPPSTRSRTGAGRRPRCLCGSGSPGRRMRAS